MFHHFTSSPSCWNHHPRGWATRRPNSPDLLLACPASAACAAALCVELLFQMRTRRMSCFGSGGETLRNVRTMENMALCNKSKSTVIAMMGYHGDSHNHCDSHNDCHDHDHDHEHDHHHQHHHHHHYSNSRTHVHSINVHAQVKYHGQFQDS